MRPFCDLLRKPYRCKGIWIDSADNQEGIADPFEGEANNQLKKHIEICYEALLKNGQDRDEAMDAITVFPAFQSKNAQALIGQMKE